MRQKTSQIWLISKEELKEIVSKSESISEAIRLIGVRPIGGNLKNFKDRCSQDGVSLDHIKKSNIGRKFFRNAIPLEDVLIQNSFYSRHALKRRLIKNGILIEKCEICNSPPVWNNMKLVLVLDHKNGISNDNRIENLRLVCPNCNSQLPTFAGKNVIRYNYENNKEKSNSNENSHIKISFRTKKDVKNCLVCYEKTKCSRTKYCSVECYHKSCIGKVSIRKRKVERPSLDDILKDLSNQSYVSVGKKYGVSDVMIRKWIKSYGAEPPRRH